MSRISFPDPVRRPSRRTLIALGVPVPLESAAGIDRDRDRQRREG